MFVKIIIESAVPYGPPYIPTEQAIQNFVAFLQRTVESVKSGDKQICAVLIGYNSQVFDTPTLLRQGGNQLSQRLVSLNVFFFRQPSPDEETRGK